MLGSNVRLLSQWAIPLVLALSISLSANAAPVYTFTNIADTRTSEFANFEPLPTISSNGIVAFKAYLDNGAGGIFAGSGGSVTTIADSSGPFRTFSSFPSVNAAGTVAFRAQLDNLAGGIYLGNGGTVTTIADTLPGSAYHGYSYPTINDSGTVAFIAGTLGRPGASLFTYQNGGISELYNTNTSLFSSLYGIPFINNEGNVVFVAGLDAGGSGVFVGNGSTTIKIADSSGEFSSFGPNPTLSNNGVAAFLGRYDAGGQGIFTGDGTQLNRIVDSNSPLFLGAFGDPSINSLGTVAFSAQTECSGASVQAGPDAINDRVLGTSGRRGVCPPTPLFDELGLTGVGFFHALNDMDQLAGLASLPHGGEVIWRANPPGLPNGDGSGVHGVPEPSTLLLTGIGMAWFVAGRRRF